MPTEYILTLVALTASGLLGSYFSILFFDRVTNLPANRAGFAGLAVWFALSTLAVWLSFTHVDGSLAAQHSRNAGMLVAYAAIWMALSVFGTLFGGVLAALLGRRQS